MGPRVLIFDNYDSFTYNLVHLVEKLISGRVTVRLNDRFTIEDAAHVDKIILSPGPGIPSEAGQLLPLVKEFASRKSMLGVCLGHQAIAEAFGGRLLNLDQVYHGLSLPVKVLNHDIPLFRNIPPVFNAGRYHSWVADRTTMPDCLEVTAEDERGLVMAIRHLQYDVQGIQFHPESILTPLGERILSNWLNA